MGYGSIIENSLIPELSSMAEAIEGSFLQGDFKAGILENAAEVLNLDNITVRKCRGHCLCEEGPNFCLCRGINTLCSRPCHGEDVGSCMSK